MSFTVNCFNMRILLTLLAVFVLLHNTMALKIDYHLGMEDPKSHYFNVRLTVSQVNEKELLFKMPVWTPGSYKIREYGRNVEAFEVFSNGEALSWEKVSKNAWKVNCEGKTSLEILYKVYAFEENIRMSFLDESHAFVTGTTVFMYLDQSKEVSGLLQIQKHSSFKRISTALVKAGDDTFTFDNYDQLVDCPIEIGNHELLAYKDHGVNYEIAIYGEGNYQSKRLVEDFRKITAEATKVFGENPNEYYLFIVHNTLQRGGGIEHSNSTVLQLNRDAYEPESQYERALGLVAHEYFHVWNVKRIRAEAMGPFNYDAEIYTDLLWLFEGFTSYYDKLILYRAGYKTKEELLNAILGTIKQVEAQPGNQVQSMRESSLDTWVKTYITDENSVNTTISYYSKGSLIALLLDILISDATRGEKNLDDVMRALYLYSENGQKAVTYDRVIKIASEVAGIELKSFFDEHVLQPGSYDYKSYFLKVGVDFQVADETKVSLGLGLSPDAYVRHVLRDSPAEKAGIYPRDILLSINGQSLREKGIDEIMKEENEAKTWKISLLRRGQEYKIKMAKPLSTSEVYSVEVMDENKLSLWLK